MEGVYINSYNNSSVNMGSQNAYLELLAKRSDIEVMVQTLLANATVWITPADDRETLEFFYVLSGSITLCLKEGEVFLKTGGCFYVEDLSGELHIETAETTKLLYVTNRPMFDFVFGYQGDLNSLMKQLDEKDNYTYRHSRNVMEYSVLLMRRLEQAENSIDDIVTAALFHDVGKCFVPDDILKKPGKLTHGEFLRIMKHPLDSARLLEQKFSKKIADIAKSHHERLDGSGYPYGLSRDEISLEGKIIAVADSFDAMKTQRVYSQARGYLEAAEELCNMPNQYDNTICRLLKELVLDGMIPLKGENR